jgi:hypothetical protein
MISKDMILFSVNKFLSYIGKLWNNRTDAFEILERKVRDLKHSIPVNGLNLDVGVTMYHIF